MIEGRYSSVNSTLKDETSKPVPVIVMKYLKRLRGHSSFITHLDWSMDNQLIRSTCGGYELLYWEVAAGRQILSSLDNIEGDTLWSTNTCIFGFEVK